MAKNVRKSPDPKPKHSSGEKIRKKKIPHENHSEEFKYQRNSLRKSIFNSDVIREEDENTFVSVSPCKISDIIKQEDIDKEPVTQEIEVDKQKSEKNTELIPINPDPTESKPGTYIFGSYADLKMSKDDSPTQLRTSVKKFNHNKGKDESKTAE